MSCANTECDGYNKKSPDNCSIMFKKIYIKYCKYYKEPKPEHKYTHEQICKGYLETNKCYNAFQEYDIKLDRYQFGGSYYTFEELQEREIVPIPPRKGDTVIHRTLYFK